MTRPALAAVVGLLALAPAASARTVHDDLNAAQAHWGSSVCAGQWQVVPDATLPHRGHRGEATGLGFTHNPTSGSYAASGTRWDWHVARCEFSMDPTLQGCARYWVVAHEVGHFIHGPSHDGAMAPEAVGQIACPIKPKASRKLRAKAARAKARKRAARRARR